MLFQSDRKKLELALHELKPGVLKHLYKKRTGREIRSRGENLINAVLGLYLSEEGLIEVLQHLQEQRNLLRSKGGIFVKLSDHGGIRWIYERVASLETQTEIYPLIRLQSPRSEEELSDQIILRYLFPDTKETLNDLFEVEVHNVLVPVEVLINFEEELVIVGDSKRYLKTLKYISELLNIEHEAFDYGDLSPRELNNMFTSFLVDMLNKLEDTNTDYDIDYPMITVDEVRVDVRETLEYRGIKSISLEGAGISRESSESEEIAGIFRHRKLNEILRNGGKIVGISGTFVYKLKKYDYNVGILKASYPKLILSRKTSIDWENLRHETRKYEEMYNITKEVFAGNFFI